MLFIFESKFFSLFSLLFGMGFAIQLRRAEALNNDFFSIYRRRLLVLFALGWIHAMIYPGDIVRLYALLGFLLFLFRKWPARKLVILAIAIFLVDYSSWYVFRSGIVDVGPGSNQPVIEEVQPPPRTESHDYYSGLSEKDAARIRAYREGTILDVWKANLTWHSRWIRLFAGYGPSALCLFLIGMAIVRAGILDHLERYRTRIRNFMLWAAVIGLPGAAFSAYFVATTDMKTVSVLIRSIEATSFSISYFLMALAYASFIALKFQKPGWQEFFHPLAAVGRMALTVYVGQSIVYTTIYFAYGLGYYARLGPAHIIPIAAVIFALDIVLCNWWLKHYRFGPLEWLWRSATYMKWQPMKL
jgi:uncharacterized protein